MDPVADPDLGERGRANRRRAPDGGRDPAEDPRSGGPGRPDAVQTGGARPAVALSGEGRLGEG